MPFYIGWPVEISNPAVTGIVSPVIALAAGLVTK